MMITFLVNCVIFEIYGPEKEKKWETNLIFVRLVRDAGVGYGLKISMIENGFNFWMLRAVFLT